MERSPGKNPRGKPGSVCFPLTIGDEITFLQDNNLKHKAKSTLELHTKKTVNVPEWPSYSFDLNLLENRLYTQKCVDIPSNEWIQVFQPHLLLTGVFLHREKHRQ